MYALASAHRSDTKLHEITGNRILTEFQEIIFPVLSDGPDSTPFNIKNRPPDKAACDFIVAKEPRVTKRFAAKPR